MNTKVLLGFLAGVLAASGMYFWQSHRQNATASNGAAPLVVASIVPDPPTQSSTSVTRAADSAPPTEPVQAKRNLVRASAPKKILGPVPEFVKPSEAPIPPEPRAASPEPAPEVAVPPAPVVERPEVVAPPPPPKPETPPPPQPRSVTLASGTVLNVRLGEALTSERNRRGDTFVGTLDQPLVIDGLVIAERGAHVAGRVRDVDEAGRVKGVARLVLELTSFTSSDGQKVEIRTAGFESKSPATKTEDAEKVGVGAAIGAAIGAIAGGGKGAAIGTATGGAAGGGVVLATRGKPAVLAPETRISFRIEQPVTITERL